MKRTYSIQTFGCQMNAHDSERIAGLLEEDGLLPADSADDADVVVFNTCCVRENADNRLYGNLGILKRAKSDRPGMKIMVGGCLAQKDGARIIEKAPHVDAVFGTHNLADAADLLRKADAAGAPVCEVTESASDPAFISDLPARRDLPFAAWVTISVGCSNSCTFCIVPAVRGPESSRRPGDVIDEVERLAAEGVVEVTLLGQNVNSYGRDLGLDGHRPVFADLLRAVDAIEGIRRIRFTSPHPKDLRPETIEAMAGCAAVMPQLHLPLQSGSDPVLAAMHRGYSAERYLARLESTRREVPDLAVTTDIIVGFPGETDRDFEATLEVVAEARFDSAFTFVYSSRPGTPAAQMDAQLAPEVTSERYARLTSAIEELSLASNSTRVGRVEEVLVEGASKRDPSRLSGRTPQNRLVHFLPGAAASPGRFVSVRIDRAAPHHLMGTLVETGPGA